MRDIRFIAEHRGGLLKIEQHKQLALWAWACAEHVLSLCGKEPDQQLLKALLIAKEWAEGNVKTGVAMKASVSAHAVARVSSNPISVAVARAVGQAVATAHMADHSLGGALYALKAVKLASGSIEVERSWQNEQLPIEIREFVLSARKIKEKAFGL